MYYIYYVYVYIYIYIHTHYFIYIYILWKRAKEPAADTKPRGFAAGGTPLLIEHTGKFFKIQGNPL